MPIEPSNQFSAQAGSPVPGRSWSPDRPNTYYKGDPTSDKAMLANALDARREEMSMANMAEIPGNQSMNIPSYMGSPREYNANRIAGQTEETGYSPMSVGQAQDASDAGFPITGDAGVSNYDSMSNRTTLTDMLDAANSSRDDVESSAQNAGDAVSDAMENGITPEKQEAINEAGRANNDARSRYSTDQSAAADFVQQNRGR